MHPAIRRIEWDSAAFGCDCYEIGALEEDALREASVRTGHYSIKVEPVASKALLHQYGFYYCDTLLEPYCPRERFTGNRDPRASYSRDDVLTDLLEICHGAFAHGRFHRDFNLPHAQANLRYDNWLRQVHAAGSAYGLRFDGLLAGFLAVDDNRLVLSALAEPFRGRGLGKLLWTVVCDELFRQGHTELCTSVSAANIAETNLCITLGFRLRRAVDVYHRWTK